MKKLSPDTFVGTSRRGAERRVCPRPACLVGTQGFQYAELVELSEHGASFVTEGDACVEADIQVMIEVDRHKLVRTRFRRLWMYGNRVGGAWASQPLRAELFIRICGTQPA